MFQSYLYGIEMEDIFLPRAESLLSFNRTFMELKFDWGSVVTGGAGSFNRTFMELKCGWSTIKRTLRRFQSYLYGIEMAY